MTRNSNTAPDWSFLPHNPIAFFGLEAGFDRKSLKRKYNQLIRKYKPEKAPAEFQKIRAAYEFLDSRLRYGETPSANKNPEFQWTAAQAGEPASRTKVQKTDSADVQPIVAKVEEIPFYQRVESESPLAIYNQLKNRKGKSPFEYFSMALLSDVVADDSMMFFKLVLTGIQRHPQETGLINLLYEYLQQDFKTKQIPGLLKTISKVVTDQYFYFLTESLWDRLLRSAKFATWANTLAACESNLKDYRIEGQLAFYLHILPAAIFKADAQWLQAKYKWLDSHASEIPSSLEMDFELVFQLFEYRRSLAVDNSHSPEVHQGIVNYFVLDGQKSDEAVIELQTAFAQNPGHLLEQFGPETPVNGQQLAIWDYINDDVCQRRELHENMDPRQLRAKIFDLMADLNRNEIEAFGWMQELGYYSRKHGPYLIALGSPFALLFPWLGTPILFIVAIVLAIAAAVLVHFLYRPGDRVDVYLEKKMRVRYYSDWRGRFVHLFEATQIHHGELSNAMLDIVQHHSEKVGFASWLIRFLPSDAGLHLFASAARYLK